MNKKILIILQARSGSKRLPGKSLSLFKNIPLVVLCAKRLTNTGRKLMLHFFLEKSIKYLAKDLRICEIDSIL